MHLYLPSHKEAHTVEFAILRAETFTGVSSMTLPLISPAPPILDDDVVSASADGILQCLRVLSDECLTLHMHRTRSAIQDAVKVGELENSRPSVRGSRHFFH
jgi:hypothetical protein